MYLVNNNKGVVDLTLGTFTYFSFGNTRRSHVVRMGAKETLLLAFLVRKQGSLVTKEEMLSTVWDGQIVCENTALVALSNLRKLFRRVDLDCRCLVTVSGRGYIFYPQRSGFIIEEAYHDVQHL